MAVSHIAPVKSVRKDRTPCKIFEKYENGKKRYLKLDANALADFEQETGMGFAQMVNQRALFGATRALFWAGFKAGDKFITLESVGNLMTSYLRDDEVPDEDRGINQLMTIVLEAAVEQGALGKMKKVDEEEDPAESAPKTAGQVTEGREDESEDPNVIDAIVTPTT